MLVSLLLSLFKQVDEMNGNLVDVFNTYNVNILFTVAALPAKVSLVGPMNGQLPVVGGSGNSNLIMGGGPSGAGLAPPMINQYQSQTAGQAPPVQNNQKQVQQPPLIAKTFGDEDDLHDSEA